MTENNTIEKAAEFITAGITAYQEAIDKAILLLSEDGYSEAETIDLINQIIGALDEGDCSGCDCGCESGCDSGCEHE